MKHIKIEKSGGIATIVFENGDKNLLSLEALREFQEVYEKLSSSLETKMVLLTSGVSELFSYGLDPSEILSHDLDGRKDIFRQLSTTMIAMIDSGIPTICDVNGPALAGGAVLAFMGDIVFGKKGHVKISFSETKIGLCAPEFVWHQVAKHVPSKYHTEVIALGRNIDTQTATAMNVLNGIYDSEESRQELIQFYATRFARLDVRAVRRTIQEGKFSIRASLVSMQNNPVALGEFLGSAEVENNLKKML